jgi:membrane-bound lytic murein transglycosylase D
MKFRSFGITWWLGVALFTGLAAAQETALPAAPPRDLVFPGMSLPGDEPPPEWVRTLTERAENYFVLGARAFDANRSESAREYFNLAVDVLLESPAGARAHPALNAYYRQLIERIRYYDLQMQQTEVGWGEQRFTPSPLDLLRDVVVSDADLAEVEVRGELDFTAVAATPEVRRFLAYFTRGAGRATIINGLRRSGRYLDLARRIFAEEGVPQDLVWLAQAESGWSPGALSPAAAYGIWQFIPSTGARFGLVQNAWIDERGGIEQPTRAAARYLKWLNRRFNGDWLLAMAAYNCGEGNVERALARSRYQDFWSLQRQGLLPRETQNYVPIILSMILIAKHPELYGFHNVPREAPLRYDVLPVTSTVDLRTVATQAGLAPEVIRSYNPELLTYTVPANYRLRVPPGARSGVQTALLALQATPQRPDGTVRTRLVRRKRP